MGRSTRTSHNWRLKTRGSYSQGSYNKLFLQPGDLQPGIVTTRGSYNQVFLQPGFYNKGFLKPWVLHAGVLTTRGLTTRTSYNQGS